MDRQVGSSREVLPQQEIRVFVGPALPGTLRITEVDLHIHRYREVLAFGHIYSAIASQRAFQGGGEVGTMLTQSANEHFGALSGHLDRHAKPGMSLPRSPQ